MRSTGLVEDDPMLEFHALQEHRVDAAHHVQLLQEAKAVLLERGMADMEEYGDMLKWGLPKKDGVCRNVHVFHPDWCSFSDAFYGTIHYHGSEVRGTLLLGAMEHHTYEARKDSGGDRFLGDDAYVLTRHTRVQRAGTAYVLPARVAHWVAPLELTLTYFEEDDGEMGDLVNPASTETDEHSWTQADAEALLPGLLARIDARIQELTVVA